MAPVAGKYAPAPVSTSVTGFNQQSGVRAEDALLLDLAPVERRAQLFGIAIGSLLGRVRVKRNF
jgi:hypothetical protein